MNLAMVPAAERNSELIADFAAQCLALRKAEMGVCRPSTANKARTLGHTSDVIPVTHPAGLGHGQHTLIDCSDAPLLLWFCCAPIR